MSTAREPRKLPVVLSPDEVRRLLEATTHVKYKAALATAYGAGLRASEVTHLKVTGQRLVIRVEQGKGSKAAARTAALTGRHLISSTSNLCCYPWQLKPKAGIQL
jgi:integrase